MEEGKRGKSRRKSRGNGRGRRKGEEKRRGCVRKWKLIPFDKNSILLVLYARPDQAFSTSADSEFQIIYIGFSQLC